MVTAWFYATEKKEIVLTRCETCGQMKLEKGVPIPQGNKRGKWDFLEEMHIGDSILVTTARDYENSRSALRHRRIQYKTKKEMNGMGWRLWRVA